MRIHGQRARRGILLVVVGLAMAVLAIVQGASLANPEMELRPPVPPGDPWVWWIATAFAANAILLLGVVTLYSSVKGSHEGPT